MRDLNRYALECMEELDNLGIPYGNISEFQVNTRAKNRWGQIKKTPSGFIININAELLKEENDEIGLKNTIIHELLHSIDGCMNHGKNWKMYAEFVNRAYGYDIKRCSNADEKGVSNHERAIRTYKYAAKCDCCGQVIRRTRRSKFIEHPEDYKCGICGGNFYIYIILYNI